MSTPFKQAETRTFKLDDIVKESCGVNVFDSVVKALKEEVYASPHRLFLRPAAKSRKKRSR